MQDVRVAICWGTLAGSTGPQPHLLAAQGSGQQGLPPPHISAHSTETGQEAKMPCQEPLSLDNIGGGGSQCLSSTFMSFISVC